MRVAIDARAIHGRLQGVGRHVLNLLLGLSNRESDLEFLVLYGDPLARKLVERSGGSFRGRFQWIKAYSVPGSVFENVEIPWLLRINNATLFHDTGTTGVWTASIPSVVTVHELSALHFETAEAIDKIRRTLKSTTLIIAVSDSVAQEIESHFSISRPKIRVVANAIDPFYTERATENEIRAMREHFNLREKYFLCVTATKPSKNMALVQRLAEQWKGPEHWVFTVPGTSDSKIKYLDIVQDSWLRPLYAACAAVIVPSKYEGFSLPPIEALATGSLPVVSDIPVHREILSEIISSEMFFDAGDSLSLEKALQAVHDGSHALRPAILDKFRVISERYSCTDRAQNVQAIYKEGMKR